MGSQAQNILLVVSFLVPVGAWVGLGFPMDRASIGILGSAVISSLVAALRGFISPQVAS